MECRRGCAACCIVISISSPIPGMPDGKKAGVPCLHLNDLPECTIFNSMERPDVCTGYKPELEFCGTSNEEAIKILENLESN